MHGIDFDEILYADDTICISENERAMERLLAAIEEEGAKYGLQLNRTKCAYLKIGTARQI